jgi:hypothetical protein
MALKIKKDSSTNKTTYAYQAVSTGIACAPIGTPTQLLNYNYVNLVPVSVPGPPPIEMPEANLPRVLNYYADYGGCGYWRMLWPEYLLNLNHRIISSGMTQMILDLRFYQNIKAVRFQRQATKHQMMFIKELHKIKKDLGTRLLYEVDDIVFKNDIPDYNRCKEAFDNDEIANNIKEIIGLMDEMTVTCQYMKDYYIDKTGNKKITVIPNYAPRFWLDRYYFPEKILQNFEKNIKRPRILYSGSGTHIDVMNKTGSFKDDFHHIVDEIIKARKKFKFVWKGCFPMAMKPFIDNGDMEFLQWSPLSEYPKGLVDANCNVYFASLIDNVFNKSKSNIKMIEAGAIGLPGAYQDLCTYQEAEHKFITGKDLINQLEVITSDVNEYMNISSRARKFADGLWLEDHLDEYEALYLTEWGSAERNIKSPTLISNNKDQKI